MHTRFAHTLAPLLWTLFAGMHYTEAFGPLDAVTAGVYPIMSSTWTNHSKLQSCVLSSTASGQTNFVHDAACVAKAGVDDNPFTTIGTWNDAFVTVEQGETAGQKFGAVRAKWGVVSGPARALCCSNMSPFIRAPTPPNPLPSFLPRPPNAPRRTHTRRPHARACDTIAPPCLTLRTKRLFALLPGHHRTVLHDTL